MVLVVTPLELHPSRSYVETSPDEVYKGLASSHMFRYDVLGGYRVGISLYPTGCS